MTEPDAGPPPSAQEPPNPKVSSAERVVFFTDAVVAIAMTLLILPLMESVVDGAETTNAAQWFAEHFGQLLAFVLSFAVIAQIWVGHRRLFNQVERLTGAMLLLNFAWMFTIVWLPIPTAMVGVMDWTASSGDYDRVLIGVYTGTMVANSLLTYLLEVALGRHPDCRAPGAPVIHGGEAVAQATCILFALAMVVAVLVPAINLFSMFLLVLTGPLQAWLRRRARRVRPAS